MANNAAMEAFLARHGGKGPETKGERDIESRTKEVARRFAPAPAKVEQRDAILLNLAQANRLLAEAGTAQQAKAVVNIAHAAEVYAKSQQLGEEAIGRAHAI